MILVVSRIAIVAASCIVPRDARAGWRHAWIAQVQHYAALLRARGVKERYVRARVWHHFAGAMLDAWRLLSETPGMRQLHLTMRKPSFCLGVIGLCLVFIVVASRGLTITRAMLAAPYPHAERLVLISEGGSLTSARHAIPVQLLDYWKTQSTSFAGLAGYQWNSHGTAWVTPEFFKVVGVRPRSFMLHRIKHWELATKQQDLAIVGRLKPGIAVEAAQDELRDLAVRYQHEQRLDASEQVQVMSLVARTRQPLYAYAVVCALTALLLLAGACAGLRADRRRIGRIRRRYWAFFCAKSVSLPLALALFLWEFSRATSFTLTGGATFVAEPFFIWLVILACGAIVWWCLADQRGRCRACLQTLQYPVRIGSLGAVLFDHAGTELVCCEGHGSLYVPAVSSDYVQGGGWTALDDIISDEPVPR